MAKRVMTVDKEKVKEIYFWIINTRDIYFKRVIPLLENYTKKYVKGTFDKQKAIKGFQPIVPVGLQSYNKTFMYPYDSLSLNAREKEALAKDLYDYYEDIMKEMFKKAKKLKR